MPITSLTQSINLSGSSNYYLNHPANNGMSSGYWYYYSSSAANNTTGRKIKPYRWGVALDTNEVNDFLTIDGSIQLVSESLNRPRVFHGGGIIRDGGGIEPQLNIDLSDSFFFYHLGDLRASDNVGYWDYAYLLNGGSEWTYFQYHQHVPNVYEDYYDGRQIHSCATSINNNGNKSFGHIQPTAVSVMGVGYTNIMGRVHTPTDGFAHNQHFDQELPATQNKDYIIAGIINGTSLRFHAFYLTANGSQWDVFSRTYSRNLLAWTSEVNHGTYDLADPTFSTTTTTGNMFNFPFRVSCGALNGVDVYIPVIYNGAGGTFDLKSWKFESTNQILTNTITTQSIITGLTQRPDCHMATAGGSLYALVSDITGGGIDFYKLTGTTWNKIDDVIINGTQDIVRIHGFEYNTEDALFYALLSGDVTGSASGKNYSGSGVYKWSEGLTFSGYTHLTYNSTTSYGFKIVPPLTTGYTFYETIDSIFKYKTGSEPQGISETQRILVHQNASPIFYNKLDTDLGGSEYFYAGTQLSDGRQAVVGVVEGNKGNFGGYDLLLALYDIGTNQNEFYAAGGIRDDYYTGIVEDTVNKNLWMVGYTKSYLAQKRDIKIHGFGRGLLDVSGGDLKLEWVDMVIDNQGNQYFAGNHLSNSSSLISKYNYNFDLQWVNEISSSANTSIVDQAYGITLDSNDNIYVVGTTNGGGAGGYDSYLTKFNNSGSLIWSKYFGTTGTQDIGTSIASVTKTSTDYLVMSIVSGSATIVNVLDTNGLIVEQNKITGFVVNRVRKSESETDGSFLLAGKNNASPAVAQVAKGQVLASGNMIKWIRTYSSGSLTSEAFDIKNTEPTSGSGAGSGPKYHFVGSMGTEGFITKMVVDENAGVFTSTKQWGTSISGSIFTSLTNTPYTVNPSGSRYTYISGYSDKSPEGEGALEGLIASFDYTGSRRWTTTIGHTSDEKLFTIDRDVTNENIIVAGWSESHTDGRRTFNFRCANNGFGTGNYHEVSSVGMQMWYNSSSLNITTNNGTLSTVSAPANSAGGLTATSGSFNSTTIDLMEEFYDGGNVFDFFLAKLNLDDIAAHKNTPEHNIGCINTIEYLDDYFTFYQIGTAGDGTADDGNYFGYDIIFDSGSNIIYTIGQTSGDINKYNLGSSGVYDYILSEFNVSTEEFELYQNGSEFDEEMYALTLMNDGSGSVAFVGRTTGILGGQLIGSYDIILGIYNGVTEQFKYYSTGSGALDKAVNVHDVGNNTLALVIETAGTITSGSTSSGGLDIGVMTFNYSSSLWSTASYLAGSTSDEILGQEGKHSVYLKNSNRIAIVGKTLGTFADNDEAFGNSDIMLAIFDLNTNTFSKHQTGTNGNDTGTGVFTIGGDKIVLVGFTDSSFEEPNNGIITTFDAAITIAGKAQ